MQFRSVIFFRENIFIFYYDYKVFCKKKSMLAYFWDSAIAEPTYRGMPRDASIDSYIYYIIMMSWMYSGTKWSWIFQHRHDRGAKSK